MIIWVQEYKFLNDWHQEIKRKQSRLGNDGFAIILIDFIVNPDAGDAVSLPPRDRGARYQRQLHPQV